MEFEAASESLDGGIQVISVTGEVDLATGSELERALLTLPDDGVASLGRTPRGCLGEPERAQVFGITGLDHLFAIYPSRAAASNGDGDH